MQEFTSILQLIESKVTYIKFTIEKCNFIFKTPLQDSQYVRILHI